MKTKYLILSVTIFTLLAFTSCNKEETPVTATITIEEPSINDTITLGEELHFEGTVSGTGEMHGYTITFTNNMNAATLKSASYDTHASSYNFHEHYVNDLTDTAIVTAKIDVTLDHDGNHEQKQINVLCLPQ